MKKLLVVVLGALIILGLSYEIFILSVMGLSVQQWGDVGMAWGLIVLLYALPLGMGLAYWLKKKGQPIWVIGLAYLAGASGIGSLAGWLNFQLLGVLKQIFANHAILDTWAASITPPLVEELFKVAVAMLVIVGFSIKKRSSWFAIGFGAGLGFQMMEDHSYMLAAFIDQKGTAVQQVFGRLELAYASHWLLTGVMTLGLASLIFRPETRKNKLTYLWLLGPYLLHAFINSPVASGNTLLTVVFMVLSWALLLSTRKKNG